MHEESPDTSPQPLKAICKRLCAVVIFGVAFAYIESAVVVYLRAIFYPDGFTFPLAEFGINAGPLWRQLLLTEIGREAATLVLIVTTAWLIGLNHRQRVAYFLAIFAVWDIFFYVWLKVLINWPASVMDWDILFLIPVTWASPVIAPVIVSVVLLMFAVIILYRFGERVLKVTLPDWLGLLCSALAVVVSFCVGGRHITEADFQSHFHWSLFIAGNICAVAVFAKCVWKSEQKAKEHL
jgi:hypothetical protein